LNCAKTVFELHLFERLGLLFERKQIPQLVVNIRNSRKTKEPLADFAPLGAGGRAFKSPRPDQLFQQYTANFLAAAKPGVVDFVALIAKTTPHTAPAIHAVAAMSE
jgi:hypothetical protein